MCNEWISAAGLRAQGVCLAFWGLSAGLLSGATFTVSSTADGGAGTLRQAILSANFSPGQDVIRFDLSGSGLRTISPLTELPALTEPAVLDGRTQPGFAGTPLIELSGLKAPGGSGIRILAGGSTVQGLRFTGFDGAGLRLEDGGGNVIAGNILGPDANATNASRATPNGMGIWIGPNCSSNTIGGLEVKSRNLIIGNRGEGIVVAAQAAANVIQGNWIGVNAAGDQALGNHGAGILLSNCVGTTLGGTEPGSANVIGGNGAAGILVIGPLTAGTVIQGNQVGCLDVIRLGNAGPGIWLRDSQGITIGGTETSAGNVLSGNEGPGLILEGHGHVVQGNLIGLDRTGRTALANGRPEAPAAGIEISGSEHTIGGSVEGRNLISGNSGAGLVLRGSNVVVQANWIGVDGTGVQALGNGGDGIQLQGAASENTLGGLTVDERNVVAGNGGSGLVLAGPGVVGNVVQGNYVGLGADGRTPLGNSAWGIQLQDEAANNFLGGPEAGQGNSISGNHAGGLRLTRRVQEMLIQGNRVGTGADGTAPVPNRGPGLRLEDGTHDTVIGGETVASGNTIAFNSGSGISIAGEASTGNRITGNSLHANGGLGIDLVGPGEAPDTPSFPRPALGLPGPNHLQNFPVITNVVALAGLTVVQGTFQALPDSTCVVQVYAGAAAHPSGFGEGENYLGSVEAVTGTNGIAGFAFFTTDDLAGRVLAATLLDVDSGDTSEFGPAFVPTSGLVSPRLWIRLAAVVPRRLEIHFSAAPGRHYELQSSGSLAPAAWKAVTGAEDLVGPGGLLAWSGPWSSLVPGSFYRVRVLP